MDMNKTLEGRLASLRRLMADRGYDAVVLRNNPDLRWLTGAERTFDDESAHTALVTAEGQWLHTDSRYFNTFRERLGGDSVWDIDQDVVGHAEWAAARIADTGSRTVAIEDTATVAFLDELVERTADSVELPRLHGDICDLRMVKDTEELELLREAQRITDEAFTEILNYVKPGVTESEIAARLTYLMACKGAERNSFTPIVATGANGSKPHAIPGPALIGPGQFVTMDFGCVMGGYCSDMTRTVCVGQPSEEMELVYNTVLKAQLAAIDMIRGGVNGAAVHKAADDVIVAAGYGGKMGHGLGHSLGIEVHESPRFSPFWDKAVPAGAFLSVEPGIYLPGKFGVRIEDVVMLTEDGCIDITNSPKNLIIL